MMVRRRLHRPLCLGLLAVALAAGRIASAAPCVVACRDKVQACVAAECQTLAKGARRHCKRTCKKGIVTDCFHDLSLCGATTARPVPPPTPAPHPPPSGGW